MQGALLGPTFGEAEVRLALDGLGARYEVLDEADLYPRVAALLANEQVVGWFQNRMEFGPRALGARSILADPRSTAMQSQLNLKIKFRESFRPFAPAVLQERVSEFFDLDHASPYMLLVAQVQERLQLHPEVAASGLEQLHQVRSSIPAVTHVDYSARVQTVNEDQNPQFYRLLRAFEQQTGCPVLVNTSFNVRGEPIVCTPEDAFRCFMGSEIEVLVVGNCFLRKEDQDPALKLDYKNAFELD